MQTIKDIIAEMRKRFEPYAKSDSNDARYVAYLGYAEFADRIEAAVKALEADRDNWLRQALDEDARANQAQPVTDCNQLGNAAKMREALLKMLGIADHLLTRFALPSSAYVEISELKTIANTALAEPARNCDLYATDSEATKAKGK